MSRYIQYNITNGDINSLIIINENDKSYYITDTFALSNIGTLDVDIRNSYVDISGSDIKLLPTLPIQYNTLSYEISSSNSISLSSIPTNTSFILEYNNTYIESSSAVNDGIITFTTDTAGVYTFEFNNMSYNNLSSTSYSITAL